MFNGFIHRRGYILRHFFIYLCKKYGNEIYLQRRNIYKNFFFNSVITLTLSTHHLLFEWFQALRIMQFYKIREPFDYGKCLPKE